MSREHIETLRHFVYKATKWNDAAGEYATDIGVYDALDALEARAEADPCTCAGDNGDGSAGFCG
ncbi:MAG: hypothetical protein ACOVP8_08845, partial [Phycisphaerales bacterium]